MGQAQTQRFAIFVSLPPLMSTAAGERFAIVCVLQQGGHSKNCQEVPQLKLSYLGEELLCHESTFVGLKIGCTVPQGLLQISRPQDFHVCNVGSCTMCNVQRSDICLGTAIQSKWSLTLSLSLLLNDHWLCSRGISLCSLFPDMVNKDPQPSGGSIVLLYYLKQ